MKTFILYIFLLALAVFSNTEAQQTVTSEKIFLATDRNVYIAGETMFFKVSLKSRGSSQASRFAYLVLRNDRNTVISGICLKLENNLFSGGVYLPDTLRTGKYQIVSYTNCMRNDEKLFTSKEIIIANRFDEDFPFEDAYDSIPANAVQNSPFVTIKANKDNFHKREKVSFALEISTHLRDLTVSVRQRIHLPEQISSEDSFPKNNYIYWPEVQNVIVQGKVINPENTAPVPDATVFISVPDTTANLNFTKTDKDGIFRFMLPDYYDDKNVIIRLPEVQNAAIELDNKFDLKNPYSPRKLVFTPELRKYLKISQDIVRIGKSYGIKNNRDNLSDTIKNNLQRLYGNLSSTPLSKPVYPADFISLPDFVEISREILPFLKIRKQKNTYTATVLNEKLLYFFDGPPAIFLDGVPVDDINQIIGLNSDQIKKIETLSSERYFGGLYFKGILSVITKKQEINNIRWKTPFITAKLLVYHPSSVFITPDHSKNDQDFLPDFRQVLYWNPDLHEKNFEFFTSDLSGEFEVVVEGITENGTPFSNSSNFSVK